MTEADAIVIDARGHQCPVPSLRLQRALQDAAPGSKAVLLATDPMARIDVPFLMADIGGRVLDVVEDAGVLTITVETASGVPTDPPPPPSAEA